MRAARPSGLVFTVDIYAYVGAQARQVFSTRQSSSSAHIRGARQLTQRQTVTTQTIKAIPPQPPREVACDGYTTVSCVSGHSFLYQSALAKLHELPSFEPTAKAAKVEWRNRGMATSRCMALLTWASTAEIAANAPRYRRKSSTFIDGIHDVTENEKRAPAQLYSTMSGRLFHSGRIAIVMVGPPARGKT